MGGTGMGHQMSQQGLKTAEITQRKNCDGSRLAQSDALRGRSCAHGDGTEAACHVLLFAAVGRSLSCWVEDVSRSCLSRDNECK